MPRPHPRPAANGFTLIETLGVLLVTIILGSLFLAAPRSSGTLEAGDTAARMRAMLTAALADADLDGGDVIVRADAGAGAASRFIALAGPPGVTLAADPGADWVELTSGVVWRAGDAAVDPMGTATDGRVPGTVRCTAVECDTGAAPYVVYFVGHERARSAAWALVLTRTRDVALFRWDRASSAWEGA